MAAVTGTPPGCPQPSEPMTGLSPRALLSSSSPRLIHDPAARLDQFMQIPDVELQACALPEPSDKVGHGSMAPLALGEYEVGCIRPDPGSHHTIRCLGPDELEPNRES